MFPLPVNIFLGVLALVMTAGVAGRMYAIAFVIPGLMLFIGLLAFSPLLLAFAVLLMATVFLAQGTGMRGVSFGAVMLLVIGAANAAFALRGNPRLEDLRALRREYPIESLRPRLAFHEQRPTPGGVEAAAAYMANTAERDERLGSRQWRLKRLHDQHYEEFVRSPGFGFSRMPRVSRGSLEVPTVALVKLVSSDLCFDNRERPGRPLPSDDALDRLHRSGLSEFLDPDRMGYVETIDRVTGFESHAMATVPAPIQVEEETWQVARLELVSLLRHDTPVACLSDHLPNLEELEGLSTRPLDEFEQASLARLREGEELVTAEEPALIRMLGAVRASETCLACHQVPQTTLLGAFAYELRPVLADKPEMVAGR